MEQFIRNLSAIHNQSPAAETARDKTLTTHPVLRAINEKRIVAVMMRSVAIKMEIRSQRVTSKGR